MIEVLMYAITLFKNGVKVGQEKFIDAAERMKSVLRVAHEWRHRADEWQFDHLAERKEDEK